MNLLTITIIAIIVNFVIGIIAGLISKDGHVAIGAAIIADLILIAFSISGPTSRMTRERVEELSVDVRKVQEELSMELGWYRK